MPGEGMAVRLVGLLNLMILAYLMVLAIATAQVAVAEEDCPRPASAGEHRLLSVVVTDRGNYRQIAGVAVPGLAPQAVCTALTGAYIARRQPPPQPLRPLGKLAGVIEGNIVSLYVAKHSLFLETFGRL
jgi:hypothetical protein